MAVATHRTGMQGSLVTAVCEVAARQHGAATTHQLRRLGMSAKAQRTAVRDGWLSVIEPGVVVLAGTPDTWLRRLRVALLALDGRAWVSHEAAAALYGLDGGPAQAVEVTLPRAARGLRARAALVHTTDAVGPDDVRTVRGLRCASPTRTVIDLAAAGAARDRLRRALQSAERRGLTTAAAVAARLTELRGPGRWGCAELDAVVARPGAGRLHLVV